MTFYLGYIPIVIVSFWLFGTILYQHSFFRQHLGKYDPLKLLPTWSFFAPRPASRDSHIVIRDLLHNGQTTNWITLSCFPNRRLLHTIWHPAKRPRKVLRDASKSIRIYSDTASPDLVQYSLQYILLLHFCTQFPRLENAVARQFAIVESSGRQDRRLWITFISGFHPF
jgi:hypothetical protein